MKNIVNQEKKVESKKAVENRKYDEKLAKLAAAAPLFSDDEARAY
ncbi:MAG: hypothetical protein BWY98_00317 [Tenericutes bacterium ADurb.BinA155]|nr:MAG: hypothetical protein BWY98_00317 [Tenericutes bacterium ADurb.BinA155]